MNLTSRLCVSEHSRTNQKILFKAQPVLENNYLTSSLSVWTLLHKTGGSNLRKTLSERNGRGFIGERKRKCTHYFRSHDSNFLQNIRFFPLSSLTSTWPGQYTQLESPKAVVVDAAIWELECHCQELDLIYGGLCSAHPLTLTNLKCLNYSHEMYELQSVTHSKNYLTLSQDCEKFRTANN